MAVTSDEGQRWEKGHLIGAQFGGPPTEGNLAPQYREVNRGPIQSCDNRVKAAALRCGCVRLTVEANYGLQRKIVPVSFTITVSSADTSFVAKVVNSQSPSTPQECQK